MENIQFFNNFIVWGVELSVMDVFAKVVAFKKLF
jgi:hypothetical protein